MQVGRRSAAMSWPGLTKLRHELPAQIVVDMHADDLVERGFRLESELAGSGAIEPAGPALDDLHDERVGLVLHALGDALAGDALQRGDLLADGAADARH